MSFYKRMGIDTYINAHDTYTIYGGSRMAPETLQAMKEAAASFVDIHQMQQVLGDKIAAMTNNPGCYITNGAAGALTLAAAVCMVKGNRYHFSKLPDTTGLSNEIVVMRSQRNGYDAAIRATGAAVVEIGDADETPAYQLEAVLGPQTAAVFVFESINYIRAAMPLDEVIRIAHSKGVPVVVDAAAQIPPAENLWKFTRDKKADLALFSGGKSLCGPQDSGLILGRGDMIEDCRRFGAPNHGLCRASKTSREAMAGLYTALEQYLALNPGQEYARLEAMAKKLGDVMADVGLVPYIVPHGPVGQAYPRVFADCQIPGQAMQIAEEMKKRKIYIGAERWNNKIYISPLNLTEEEAGRVSKTLTEVLNLAGERNV